jgi:hypothetical protein
LKKAGLLAQPLEHDMLKFDQKEAAFCKKRRKNSFESGSWALIPGDADFDSPSPSWPGLTGPSTPWSHGPNTMSIVFIIPTPMTQIQKTLFASFSSEKEVLACC